MNRTVRILVCALLVTLLSAALAMLAMRSGRLRSQMTCSSLEISFSDSLRFVTERDVKDYIDRQYGNYIGQRIDSIGLYAIESLLKDKTAIKDAQAWTTDDGVLHVEISQREPVLRFQNGSRGFYVDERGFIFPLHDSYTAPVSCISGSIPVRVAAGFKGEAPEEQERIWIRKMILMDRYFKSLKAYRPESVCVLDNTDIMITLGRGDEKFILGQPDRLEEKFQSIARYFNKIKPSKDEGYYKTVIVKYNNQIVCRQKDI